MSGWVEVKPHPERTSYHLEPEAPGRWSPANMVSCREVRMLHVLSHGVADWSAPRQQATGRVEGSVSRAESVSAPSVGAPHLHENATARATARRSPAPGLCGAPGRRHW